MKEEEKDEEVFYYNALLDASPKKVSTIDSVQPQFEQDEVSLEEPVTFRHKTVIKTFKKQLQLVLDDCETSQILIIDDDQLNIKAMTLLLQQFSLSTSHATNGQDAI